MTDTNLLETIKQNLISFAENIQNGGLGQGIEKRLISENRMLEWTIAGKRRSAYLTTFIFFILFSICLLISIVKDAHLLWKNKKYADILLGGSLDTSKLCKDGMYEVLKKPDISNFIPIIIGFVLIIGITITVLIQSSKLYFKGETSYYNGITGKEDYDREECIKNEKDSELLKIFLGSSIGISVLCFCLFLYGHRKSDIVQALTALSFSIVLFLISIICILDFAVKIDNTIDSGYKCDVFFPSQ